MIFLSRFFIIPALLIFSTAAQVEEGDDPSVSSTGAFVISNPANNDPEMQALEKACKRDPSKCSDRDERIEFMKQQRLWEAKEARDKAKADRKKEQRELKKEQREYALKVEEKRTAETKDIKEECKTAREDYDERIKDKKDKQKDLQEELYELDQQITKIESSMAEDQSALATALNDLQNTSNQNVQAFKDEMKIQIEEQVTQAIKQMQDTITQLQAKQESIKIKTDAAYLSRRQAINQLYVACFTEATAKTKKAEELFIGRKRAGAIKRSSLQSLAKGTKQNIRTDFQAQFDRFLHSCLKRPDVTIQTQDAQAKLVLVLTELNQMKINMKKQIAQLQNQIRSLATNKKIEIMTEFKDKMQREVKQFNKEYETRLANFQTKRQQINQEVEKIKQHKTQKSTQSQQAESTVTPQDKQLNLLLYRCKHSDQLLQSASSRRLSSWEEDDDLDMGSTQ